MIPYDSDDAATVPLDPDYFDAACDAATEAAVAGLDNQEQLQHAIRVYLWCVGEYKTGKPKA